jgi:hypothetical protein
VQAKEKDKEREKERKNIYLPFSAAAGGEHIHTLIYIENIESSATYKKTQTHTDLTRSHKKK